jgi:hypothetical protein
MNMVLALTYEITNIAYIPTLARTYGRLYRVTMFVLKKIVQILTLLISVLTRFNQLKATDGGKTEVKQHFAS